MYILLDISAVVNRHVYLKKTEYKKNDKNNTMKIDFIKNAK